MKSASVFGSLDNINASTAAISNEDIVYLLIEWQNPPSQNKKLKLNN